MSSVLDASYHGPMVGCAPMLGYEPVGSLPGNGLTELLSGPTPNRRNP
jgi:hypothetical protein